MQVTTYLPHIIAIAKQAGKEILKFLDEDLDIKLKPDDTPVTAADLAANKIIKAALQALTPDIPILSEEDNHLTFIERQKWNTLWLVDPLDGTEEFIRHSHTFTVNIALIKNHRPVLGVIYAPFYNICYFASANNGTFKEDSKGNITRLHTKKVIKNNKIRILVSKNLGLNDELKNWLSNFANYQLIHMAGALKMCCIAEGKADLYPRFGLNCEWDTAAGQCILEEAGGGIFDLNGKPVQYNTKESLYNPDFVAVGDFRSITSRP